MKRSIALTTALITFCAPAVFGQDAMQYGLKHLQVLAENDKVRVVRFAPNPGDKTPLHSHPDYVVYVIKGGRVKYTLPDGSTTISELKSGQVLLKPAVTHSDEAIDAVETIIVELKK
jgi:quercetin dioxygenase-like cupin family protein